MPTPTDTAWFRRQLGLMNPNHYLAVGIRYLLSHRLDWPVGARRVGKTLVSG